MAWLLDAKGERNGMGEEEVMQLIHGDKNDLKEMLMGAVPTTSFRNLANAAERVAQASAERTARRGSNPAQQSREG